jgi:gliding motility-associated-like protein
MATFKLAKTACILALLTFFSLFAQAQPSANFNANTVSGCAPLVVSFHDLSAGNPTQWRWDLGNGTISFLQHPSVTYFNPGIYNIKLVVQNANGTDSIIKNAYIQIFASPTVDFTGNPLTGCYPLPVQFNDLSTAGNGTVNSWQWDFGDGNSSTLQHPSHVYSAAGNYNVSLRVGNSSGCFTTVSRSQYVHINEGVHAAFTHSAPNSCTPPVDISFQNQSTGTGVLGYEWDFGDGGSSTQANPVHQYTIAGNFSVRLIVTNSTGCKDTLLVPSAINIGTVQAGFTVPDTICENQPFLFQNSSVPTPVSATWTFGDGTSSTAIHPLKTFATAGVYTVKLVSNFGACVDSTERNITVLARPHAAFQADDTASCSAPFTVNFINNSTGGVGYEWNFGDGNTSNAISPAHTYLQTGQYTVRLVVTNANGCTDTLIRSQYILVQLPVVTINNLPQQGCAPLSWTFGATVNSIEPVTSYQWDFGDGQTGTAANPTHVFAAGNYTIRLIITTANGCTDTVTVQNGIRAGIKPVANFTATPRDVCARFPVNFTDLSTGTITQWLWNFGDGGTSAIHNPSHVYEDTGFFTIQLIVFNNGCADTLQYVNYVHISPPIASFTPSFDCSNPFQYTFNDASIGADEWNWNFGDGYTSTAQSPVHTYASTGMYHVSLLVRNHLTGCDYETSHDIQIVSEQADFDVSSREVCRNTALTFNAINSDPTHISAYDWNFGDGSTGNGRSVAHVYTVSGNYPVTLIITDISGCKDTLTQQTYIRVNGPVANFGSSTPGSCLLSNIQFTDSSHTDGTHPIVSWIWNYGDGNIETLSSGPFQHTYSTAGLFNVSLTVTDNAGCTDNIIRNSLLTISHPQALFSSIDTNTCPNKIVHFINSSLGPSLSYHWDFGDGTSSTQAQPTHIYNSDGLYTIRLRIVDQYGCSDSLTKQDYINVTTPVASFTVSDSVSSCPPLIVQFNNTSQHYSSFDWDFGDGSHSQVAAPSHFYAIPGTYIARLTVTGPGGCTSIKRQTITVRGPYGSFTYGALSGCKPLQVNFRASTQNRSSFIWDFNDGTTITTNDSIISHTYTIAGIYVPKMILKDVASCMVPITGPDTIVVNGITAAFDLDTHLLCDNGAVQFSNRTVSNDAITGYSWDFGDGTSSAQANPTHVYNAVGTYYPKLRAFTASGCRDSITSLVPVRVVKKPDTYITRSPDGCIPLTVTYNGRLNNPDTSAIQWAWDFGNGKTSNLQNPLAELYDASGNFPVKLYAVNSSGCRDTAQVNINVFPLPNVYAGLDSIVCKGRGISIHATGAATYSWSPSTGLSCNNCPSPVANPDSAKTYIVTGRSLQGCFKKDTVNIAVQYPFTMNRTINDTICVGSPVHLSASGADEYAWSPVDGISNPSSASITAYPKQTTIYRVIGRDKHHCFADTALVPVKVYPIPTVEAGADATINVGQTIDLVPQLSADVSNVIWSPTGSIFRSNYPGITVKPRETTRYTVEVTNPGGCRSTDALTVYVICNGANVFIPNTFSPNGDGANDVFYPRGTGLFSIKALKVFNRWGELVYHKNDFQANDERAGWDGRYKNAPQNPDVYVYIMEILCDNNTVLTYKGNIALIK